MATQDDEEHGRARCSGHWKRSSAPGGLVIDLRVAAANVNSRQRLGLTAIHHRPPSLRFSRRLQRLLEDDSPPCRHSSKPSSAFLPRSRLHGLLVERRPRHSSRTSTTHHPPSPRDPASSCPSSRPPTNSQSQALLKISPVKHPAGLPSNTADRSSRCVSSTPPRISRHH